MDNMTFQIIRTVPYGPKHYIDLAVVNGVLKTQIFHKTSEPNNFSIMEEYDNDEMQTAYDKLEKDGHEKL